MQVIKTAFITGCFGVDIIFYIENKESYNYLKNMRSFCATLYKGSSALRYTYTAYLFSKFHNLIIPLHFIFI